MSRLLTCQKTIPCGRGCADGCPRERFVDGCLVSHPETGESADGKIPIVFKVALHILVNVLCVYTLTHTFVLLSARVCLPILKCYCSPETMKK